jgi:hypothetical protein
MFIDPETHLAITRQRHEAALARASHYRLADPRCCAAVVAEPEEVPSLFDRLRRLLPPRRILRDAGESA